jgi:hypothetical protein
MPRSLISMIVLAAVVCGCGRSPTPLTREQSNADALAALRDDRPAFEAAAGGDRSEDVMRRLHKRGVLCVQMVGQCTEFSWPFTNVIDDIPVIYYAPSGEADLPSGFWQYYNAMEVDRYWFVARKP